MTIKNVTLDTIDEPKKRGRKPGSKNIIENPLNEAWDWFDGSNMGENAPLDDLLSGKKLVYKKRYTIQLTNTKRHGQVATEERAAEPSYKWDQFYNRKYDEGHFIVIDKKLKKEVFNQAAEFGKGFIILCDFLNEL